MSCRISSARQNIPFNQKQRNWTHPVITDFKVMNSISMDLKVMPSSNRGYNYLLVMRCNNSRFIVTECLMTRQANGGSRGNISKFDMCSWHQYM